jgi:hypothetical protein
MPVTPIRIGVPQVQLAVDSSIALPSLSTLVFTASGHTLTDSLLNDINSNLSASDTYQVIVGLVGRDATNKGYTVGHCSPSSGNLVISAGQGIKVSVLNSNWPANYDKAVCAALFLKINNADFQLAGFAFIDDQDDFSHVIPVKPLRAAPKFSSALLQSTTSNDILGDRAPLGFTYETLEPTTDAVTFTRSVSNVTVPINSGPDFSITTTRATTVNFQVLLNDIKTFVKSVGGNYVKYSDGADVVQEAQQDLLTAVTILRGNRPFKVTMPPDSNGLQEIRLFIGLLTVNQQELTENWTKTAVTPVTFNFQPAALDKLITNQHAQIVYLRQSS